MKDLEHHGRGGGETIRARRWGGALELEDGEEHWSWRMVRSTGAGGWGRALELEDGEECCEMLSSGHDMADTRSCS